VKAFETDDGTWLNVDYCWKAPGRRLYYYLFNIPIVCYYCPGIDLNCVIVVTNEEAIHIVRMVEGGIIIVAQLTHYWLKTLKMKQVARGSLPVFVFVLRAGRYAILNEMNNGNN